MGSDGLWDELTHQQVTDVIHKQVDALRSSSNRKDLKNSISLALFELAFSKAAQHAALTTYQLKNIPQGSNRRNLHDDITILVFDL
jgi:serine/threonine protein phosphatase PrpC